MFCTFLPKLTLNTKELFWTWNVLFAQLQGQRQIMDILTFVFRETAALGKKAVKNMPVLEKLGILSESFDDVVWDHSMLNGAPVLILFFDKNNEFEFADVAADECVIHLQASDVIKAVVGYLAVYFVFHLGFAAPHGAFLSFLQVFLKIDVEGKKSMALAHFSHLYEAEKKKMSDLKAFKKHSINGWLLFALLEVCTCTSTSVSALLFLIEGKKCVALAHYYSNN